MYRPSGINGLLNCRWKWSPRPPIRPQTRHFTKFLTLQIRCGVSVPVHLLKPSSSGGSAEKPSSRLPLQQTSISTLETYFSWKSQKNWFGVFLSWDDCMLVLHTYVYMCLQLWFKLGLSKYLQIKPNPAIMRVMLDDYPLVLCVAKGGTLIHHPVKS